MSEVNRAIASVLIDLLPDGRARISSTCGGKPDASYVPMADARVGKEVDGLLAELRERLSTASTAAKHQEPLCEGPWVSCPRLSDSVAHSVCSGCGAVVKGGVGLGLCWHAQPMHVLGDGPEVETLQCFVNRADAFRPTPESALSASQSGNLTLAQRLLVLVRCGWSSSWRRSP